MDALTLQDARRMLAAARESVTFWEGRVVELSDPRPEPPSQPTGSLCAGDLAMDAPRQDVTWRGRPVAPLTAAEFRVLWELARRPGIIRTRQLLMDAASGPGVFVNDRTIDSHVKRHSPQDAHRRSGLFGHRDGLFAGLQIHGLTGRNFTPYRPGRRAGAFSWKGWAALENNLVAGTTGTAAVTVPFWWGMVSPAHQVVMAILGLVLLVLTIRAKLLDLRIKADMLRDAEERRQRDAGVAHD